MTVQVRSETDAGESVRVVRYRQLKVSELTLDKVNYYLAKRKLQKIGKKLKNQDEAVSEAIGIAMQFIDGEKNDN